jgi:hypothetical protein
MIGIAITDWGLKMNTLAKSIRIASLLMAGVLSAGAALAADVKVSLTGAEETPPVTSSATGTGTIKIAADKSVSGGVKTSGIEGTVAHIHVGAPGKAGPPIITLTKNADGSWSVPAGSKLTDEQFANFKAGELYVNVHSAEHKAGEIRGQLKP